MPISGTSISTTSPWTMFSVGPSVPIHSTSPGCIVRYWLIRLMYWRTEKIASPTWYL